MSDVATVEFAGVSSAVELPAVVVVPGLDAYDLDVQSGTFTGTKAEWLQQRLESATALQDAAEAASDAATATGQDRTAVASDKSAAQTARQASQDWAEKPTAPVSGSKSAKTWAGEAGTSAGLAVGALTDATTMAGVATDKAGIATTKANDAASQAGVATTQAGIASAQRALGEAARGGSEAARDAAQTYANTTFTNAQLYTTETAGRDAVADGAQFSWLSADGRFVNRSQRASSSASTLITSYPTAVFLSFIALTDGADGLVLRDNIGRWIAQLSDGAGNAVFKSVVEAEAKTRFQSFGTEALGRASVQSGGRFLIEGSGKAAFRLYQKLSTSTSTLVRELADAAAFANIDLDVSLPGLTLKDAMGRWLARLDGQGNLTVRSVTQTNPVSGAGGDFSAEEVLSFNARTLALTASRRARAAVQSAAPVWDWNLFVSDGQSLSLGSQGFPALTKDTAGGGEIDAALGLLMLGDGLRPLPSNFGYVPMGSAVLNPLKATNQDAANGTIISDATIAAMDPNAGGVYGESPLFAALVTARRLELAHKGILTPTNKWIGAATGRGGTGAAQFSKATNTWYQRWPSLFTQIKALADAAGKTVGLAGIIRDQGQDDVSTVSKADWKAIVSQYYDDIYADAQAILGAQPRPPVYILETGGTNWATDSQNIQMAQVELAQERPDMFMVGATSQYPDKSGHLTANGYRWAGCVAGKAIFDTSIRRLNRKPVEAIQAGYRGKTLLIGYHTENPPLAWRNAWVILAEAMRANKGFYLSDDNGTLPINSVELPANTDAVVKITFTRAVVGTLRVTQGRKTGDDGVVNLADSDPTVLPLSYVYQSTLR